MWAFNFRPKQKYPECDIEREWEIIKWVGRKKTNLLNRNENQRKRKRTMKWEN